MEGFKKQLKRRQTAGRLLLMGTCTILLLSGLLAPKDIDRSDFMAGFSGGFQVGLVITMVGFLVYSTARTTMALRDPARMKKLYIEETDERQLMIMQKSGSVGMNVAMFGLAIGSAVAANFNTMVFFSLLGACVFVTLVRGALKLYYLKKF